MPNFPPLAPGEMYHVCTRGNNHEDLFTSDHDRRHFLELCEARLLPVADLFAYCLLTSHFHLLLRFRDHGSEDPAPRHAPSRVMADMLNAYARAFNLDHGRRGALFQRPFRRVLVRESQQLTRVVVYIHHNPERHGLVPDFRSWTFTSFHAILSARPTRLRREEVLDWFGGRQGFAQSHAGAYPFSANSALELEREPAPTT